MQEWCSWQREWQCKGFEVGMCLVCSKNSKKASAQAAECVRRAAEEKELGKVREDTSPGPWEDLAFTPSGMRAEA